ncbi:hypothetical protein [Asanoa siamensis]|uniref:Uncharacterized protein n=1 Tax=Asanoa siamensis TaxID=926357 RepID=A0ABQ4D441_9ACTN|nr:hypothetical protein [Asanoa siamensis]GIF78314.1 hypothetical protein Asi02nite_78320 [Asanoa siamensis]
MTGWPDRAAAERLLDGAHADTPLGRVLTHARGPAGPHELLGEGAAVAGFRAADRAPAPSRARRAVSRVLAVKVAVVGALLTGSGLAVASVTGTLPGVTRDEPRPAPVVPAPSPAPVTGVDDPARRVPAGTPPRTPGGPPSALPNGRGKGPDEHARSPHPRRNSAHPTPVRKNQPSKTPKDPHP